MQRLFQRFLMAIPTLFGISVVSFILIHIMPGNPIDALVPPDATPDVRMQVIHMYGLDKPLLVQYGLWLFHAVQGDFGQSIGMRVPVIQLLKQGIQNTLILAVAAGFVGFFAGSVLGVTAGIFRGKWIDRLISSLGLAGVSIPAYWFAMVMVIVFSVKLNLLPTSGMHSQGMENNIPDLMVHMILPAVALSFASIGLISRMVRASFIQVVTQDFVMALRAKGLFRGKILWHLLRNAALPVLTVMGLEMGQLLGGSVLIETIFSWPGLGGLLNSSIGLRDIPVIQGGILLIGTVFVVLNIVVDYVNALVDPRIQKT
ncbi:ABC transporter permease [Paenibacillus humicola]|uniref:ABC transporter permease n=1 Tax=Paenibacillus humicola TaxID=3110540 RepID=UPI00237A322B|nr:ABC transporter permease [Paenibacillus humicola]